MIEKIKYKILTLSSLLVFSVMALMPAVAYAQNTPTTNQIDNNLCGGTTINLNTNATTCQAAGVSGSVGTLNSILTNVVNIFSVVVGIIAVIMIIVGGMKYIISGGESSNVSGAKNTIIFALVGLVIVALAQVIVHYVIAKLTPVNS